MYFVFHEACVNVDRKWANPPQNQKDPRSEMTAHRCKKASEINNTHLIIAIVIVIYGSKKIAGRKPDLSGHNN